MNLIIRIALLLIAITNCSKSNEFGSYQIIEEIEGRKRVKYFDKSGLLKIDYYLMDGVLDKTIEKQKNPFMFKGTSFTRDGKPFTEMNYFFGLEHGRAVGFDENGNVVFEKHYKFGVEQK
jgi:antitoxin component YwqK of YwqJK toxin-antitoxin module